MIRENFVNDDFHRQLFLEGAEYGANQTLNTLMDHWKDVKDRKGARADVAKIRARFSLESELHLPRPREAGESVRPIIIRRYTGMEIGRFINDIRPTHREAKSWLKRLLNIIGQSTFVASVVVVLALGMGA